MHIHHIMPRHLGGSNDSENLVKVTVEEHAKIHHSLWILGGRWQDEIAWRALSGQISSDVARRKACSLVMKEKWADISWREKQSQSKETHHFRSSEYHQKYAQERLENGTHNFFDKEAASKRNKKRLSNGDHPFIAPYICPKCGIAGRGKGNLKMHLKRCKEKK